MVPPIFVIFSETFTKKQVLSDISRILHLEQYLMKTSVVQTLSYTRRTKIDSVISLLPSFAKS